MVKTKTTQTQQTLHQNEVNRYLSDVAQMNRENLFEKLNTSAEGLCEKDIQKSQEKFGKNIITKGKKESIIHRIAKAFINPFTVILILLALVSGFMDIYLAEPGEEDFMAVIIILTMVTISGILRFIQETRSGKAAEKLTKMIRTTTCVQRLEYGTEEIPLEDVVVGDLVLLAAGDMIPADMRIIRAKDLFISQSALTGESEPIEKTSQIDSKKIKKIDSITEYPTLAFMGSNVISGSAEGIVVSVGDQTLFGNIAQSLNEPPVKTSFEKGVNSVSWVLIRFMLIMVPFVLFINGFTKGNWLEAFLFALSVAVGLTPEMLPMIVTTCLAKGAVSMSKEKTIVKNLNSIQNLGSIDILCTDKTGTLTQDKVVLEYHLNLHGQEDLRVLRHAFFNSYYQTGLKNLMDVAIIDRLNLEQASHPELNELLTHYSKVDEIPFDFERRRMSVVIENNQGKTQMITKGAVEEIFSICKYAEYNGEVTLLTEDLKRKILEKVYDLNDDGMRVIGIAQKNNPAPVGAFSVSDESEMVLIGYLAFLDPPKSSAMEAIQALKNYNVQVKVLTGDNEKVTRCICRQVQIPTDSILLGAEIDQMDDEQLATEAKQTHIFAKLSPQQKARIIRVLREDGHSVGYLGDGINDAAALKVSDVGISVDTAVDIAKESADVILLEKDLMVLEKGIIEGRRTYANMIKYIKMTASSNFGNMFSVLIASAFLPFLPMLPIHLLLLNLIYDFSCTAIPWDHVDEDYLRIQRKWDASSIGKFMLWIGPTSSVFDITTYLLMYFIICPAMTGGLLFTEITDPAVQLHYIAIFQSGWFIESMWTQTLVIHMLRTPKIPFIQSRASFPVMALTFTGILFLTLIPFTAFGSDIGLTGLNGEFFYWLALTIVLYMALVTVFKKIFIRRYGELL